MTCTFLLLCPIYLLLKSGLPVANWIREFCFSYDKRDNYCVPRSDVIGRLCSRILLTKDEEDSGAVFQAQPWKTNQGVS